MKDIQTHERHQLAEKLRFLERDVIEVITTNFCQQHPETKEPGEVDTTHCITDARYHLTFLRTAIEFGTEETFRQYLRWTTKVLQTRNIPHHVLQRFLEEIFHALEPHLTDSEKLVVRTHFLDVPESGLTERQTPALSESPLALHQEVFLQALLAGDRHAARMIALGPCQAPTLSRMCMWRFFKNRCIR